MKYFVFLLLLSSVSLCFGGEPVAHITIAIEQSPSGLVKTLQTDKDGKATFTNLPPGNYWIMLSMISEKTQKLEKAKLNQRAIVTRVPDSLAKSARVIVASVAFEKAITLAESKLKIVVTVSATSIVVVVRKVSG